MKKIRFDEIRFMNRWKQKSYSRNCDWTIIGVTKWWFGPESFCYKICFFGLEAQIWIKRF
ncbi:hypothetical protein [Psychroserpens damuponensis]|uniref:hypothetical protein n=1 Tax=Psychroserpens damuponensis TaxID=943936 RepID=UPI00058F4790|nr:hypothetical protein [Psychroserpens damuponensis]